VNPTTIPSRGTVCKLRLQVPVAASPLRRPLTSNVGPRTHPPRTLTERLTTHSTTNGQRTPVPLFSFNRFSVAHLSWWLLIDTSIDRTSRRVERSQSYRALEHQREALPPNHCDSRSPLHPRADQTADLCQREVHWDSESGRKVDVLCWSGRTASGLVRAHRRQLPGTGVHSVS
jgi:hypothetical protein